VTDAREFEQLTEILKEKLQAEAQRFGRCEERETKQIQNKTLKEDTKKF
jgi:hypothetical protein